MKKTSTTTTTTTKDLNYIPKLIINGTEVAQQAKQVTTTIKGTEVTLNCTYISEIELKDAYTSGFNITVQGKTIEVVYAKINNRVSATVYIGNVVAFSSLSMQAVFTALNTAYGISKSTLNNLYVKSNATRKQSNSSINKVVVNNSFEF